MSVQLTKSILSLQRAGYQVFPPAFSLEPILLIENHNSDVFKVYFKSTTYNNLVNLPLLHPSIDFLLTTTPQSPDVWLIPIGELGSSSTFRLSSRFDIHKLVEQEDREIIDEALEKIRKELA